MSITIAMTDFIIAWYKGDIEKKCIILKGKFPFTSKEYNHPWFGNNDIKMISLWGVEDDQRWEYRFFISYFLEQEWKFRDPRTCSTLSQMNLWNR